ncbi:hypothetical protein JCM19239_7053 [Vibrio variabilis]|uniref:DUF1214 domain-containing protein n=1 Tax=Vibrio variabilis TaxID=990271 RepID=A0ABQ0JM21_9VIBR|nr:hypothetical protein JCM19239_7053 [Vibrio variabilis]
MIADADGNLVVGEESYVIRFEAGELPPVNAFWSLTVYDKDGFQVPNELNRFALGDRDELTLGDDGSLELYIQSEAPSEDKMSNWLPSPSEGT